MTVIFGLLTLLIAAVSYSFYIRDILRGRTKPHGFTWAIWAVLSAFIFSQQMGANAGPGAWSTIFVSVAATVICLLSIRYGERSITKLDWLSLFAVAIVFIIWAQNHNAAVSVLLASSAFLLGFMPTIRKSVHKAQQETVTTYALNSLKFLIALFALHSFTVETATYPFVLFVANALFAAFLVARTSALKDKKQRTAPIRASRAQRTSKTSR